MTPRSSRWLAATLVVTAMGMFIVGCGADPVLQQQESVILARTCVSLRERAGKNPAPQPPDSLMVDFLRQVPHDDHGPMTKEVLEQRCGISPTPTTTTPGTPRTGTRP